MISLDYYKLQKLGASDKKGEEISLTYGEGELVGIYENAEGRVNEEEAGHLAYIIQKINDVFGVGLAEDDRIIIDQYEEMFKNEKISWILKNQTAMRT